MKVLSRQSATIIGIILLIAALFLVLKQSSVYSGKPLKFWLLALSADKPLDDREKAADVILQFGTNVLPALIEMLSSKDHPLKRGLVGIAEEWHYASRLKRILQPAYERRQLAVRGFRVLGDKAAVACPAITNLLKDATLRDDACLVLCNMGSSGIEAVSKVLVNQEEPGRYRVIYGVCNSVVNSSVLDRALLKCLNDTDLSVAQAAKWALGKDGKAAEIMVPLLMADLRSADESERISAARALGHYADCTPAVLDALKLALHDKELVVRQSVSNTLQRIETLCEGK